MRISLDGLADFVDVPPLSRLVPTLVQVGIEVEAIDDPAAGATGVVVARIASVAAHPKAQRLQICQVEDGTAVHTVVCGATNLVVGQQVAFARVGARLGDLLISARSLRGVTSEGMICARGELGLPPADDEPAKGIWVLPSTAPLGADIWEVAAIAPVLTLGITANRPDLLSHLGVAREVAAATGKRCRPLTARASEKGPEITSLARLVVEDNVACRRYALRVVRNVRVGPSPAWLAERLARMGQRSINNVVDVTNYVMFELGQPLHAFDLARIGVEASLPTVRLRRAQPGEKLTTLDGSARELSEEDLVVADAARPLALAGIIGGEDSEVGASTSHVLLEAAFFEAPRIYASARRQGLRTEASLRCERGTDPDLVLKVLERAAQLVADVAGGEIAKGVLEAPYKPDNSREIVLRTRQLPRRLGIDLPAESIVQLLEPLNIRCLTRTERALIFVAPGFRADINHEVDLIEEVARRYGYDQIPERLPSAAGPCGRPRAAALSCAPAVAAALSAGLNEVRTEAFAGPQRFAALGQDVPQVRLLNPLGEEFSCMRTSLLPGMLAALQRNQARGQRHLRLFEVGTVFAKKPPGTDPTAGDPRDVHLPEEREHLAVVMVGGRSQGAWYGAQDRLDFTDLKGALDAIVESYLPVALPACRAVDHPTLQPGCSSLVEVEGVVLGYAGALAAPLLKIFGVTGPVWVAELEVARLRALPPRVRQHQPLPRFPGTRRDVALVAPQDLPCTQLQAFIAAHAGGNLGRAVVERVALFDVYRGAPLQQDQVSLAFSIEYRRADRTLTDAEVGEAFASLLQQLPQRFAVQVRQQGDGG